MNEKITISFLSGKGGVGKTTLAVNLGKLLSTKFRVLIVDCDLMNRGATYLFYPEKGQQKINEMLNINDIFKEKSISYDNEKDKQRFEGFNKISNNLYLIPVSEQKELQKISQDDKYTHENFINKIKTIASNFDIQIIIFDCPPILNKFIGTISQNTDFNILVTEANNVAFRGTEHLRFTLSDYYKVRPENIYILLNKAENEYLFTNLGIRYRNAISDLLKMIDVIGIIPYDHKIRESFNRTEKFFIDYYKKSLPTKQLQKIIVNILSKTKIEEKVITNFKQDKKSLNLSKILYRFAGMRLELIGLVYVILSFFVFTFAFGIFLNTEFLLGFLSLWLGIALIFSGLFLRKKF